MDQHFIVSMFRSTKDAFKSYYAISASLLSARTPKVYQDRPFGYLYNPEPEQIIGMAPTDLGLHGCAEKRNLYESLQDPINNLITSMLGDIKPCAGVSLRGIFSDYRRIYPFEEFISKTEGYNEIVLSEDTAPTAIFTFGYNVVKYQKELSSLCYATGLPLVVWDERCTYVVPVKKLEEFLASQRCNQRGDSFA